MLKSAGIAKSTLALSTRGDTILKKFSEISRKALKLVYGDPVLARGISAPARARTPSGWPPKVALVALRTATPRIGQIDLGKKFY